ncbi:NADPH-dependent FMN reductase [Solimonas terrae]|uniref:NAD(P)H-dependent oxidoreductase n=1 Tax=Solimonas terrae TaxID=1396819 RepID=A0A6M2BV38_9GAMM|nr:NADPH-dependent FMN reductase [Solimonas terrae]NGY06522.1 NAD(P)H-dependent oxidoreductase [Solimonas terrae]
MNWLAICGSLRRASSNLALLEAAARLVPADVSVATYSLAALPLFNPDLEDDMPPAVRDWRAAIAGADGLLISSPEYAHGVSGVMKNALDWLVSGPEFVGKPVALLNATMRAEYAPAQLAETLRTMSGTVIEAACLSLPLLGGTRDAAAIVGEPSLAAPLRAALARFAAAVTDPAR